MKTRWRDDTADTATDLATEIFKIVPLDKADVVALMYKILYQEDSVGLR